MAKFKWKNGKITGLATGTEPQAAEPEKRVDMSKFIPKPKTIEAVKWDGSPEGAAEVKAFLEGTKFVMDGFTVAYDSEGKLDKRSTEIVYYELKGGKKPDREDYPYYYKTYNLHDGWLVIETPGTEPKKVSDSAFKSKYMELGQVTYDDYLEWFGEAT